MEQVFERIKYLRENNAEHIKGGWKMLDRELTDTKVLGHAAAEIVEIAAVAADADARIFIVEDIREEIADAMNCLIHYAVRQGITAPELEAEMLHKLDIRFR